MAFLFEGQVLYGLLDFYKQAPAVYVISAIVAHFAGLISCGFFAKFVFAPKRTIIIAMGVCLAAMLPIFFLPSDVWLPSLVLGGYASGCAVAAWGYFLKAFTAKNERIRSCADVLICSNVLMIIINIVAVRVSLTAGLICAAASIPVGMVFIAALPANGRPAVKIHGDIKKSLTILFIFIAIISVNAGLMYQVINPAFGHLASLVNWYWAVPYIVVIAIMRSLPVRANRPEFLYGGLAVMVGAFVSFMALGRDTAGYIIVDTLLLGACGIFDLFWWSVLGEMLDYTDNPIKVFGVGLSANVLGILCGAILGMSVTSLHAAELTVIALVLICVTLGLLPPLNRQLAALLAEQEPQSSPVTETLTEREKDVLQLILAGKSNSVIAEDLLIKESTVKTHVRSIYSKCLVANRAELITAFLGKK